MAIRRRLTSIDPDRAAMTALAAAAIVARVLPGTRTIDDAYITFRYARNIVNGLGFVYNPGQTVLGTTTPLFTGLMALLSFITGRGAFPGFALFVSALADAVTCVLLYRLARRLTGARLPGLAVGALWAVAPMSVTFAIGGMETSIFIMLMMLTFWLHIKGWGCRAALTAALGVLARPDALLWAGLVFAHQLWVRVRRAQREGVGNAPNALLAVLPWRTWAVFAAVLLPWVLFAFAYFGSPLPRSVGAKTLTYTLPTGATLTRLIQHFATPFFEYDILGALGTAVGMVLYPMLFAIGALSLTRGTRGDGRALPMLVYPWIYAALFAITNLLLFRWYLAPPLPVYFLGIVAGVWVITGAVRRQSLQRAIFTVVALGWLVLTLNAWELHPDHGSDRPAPEMAFIKLELLYEQVGRALAGEYGVTAETVVSAGDIGALGYFSGAVIFDTIGLVTPEAGAYYPVDPELIAPGNNYAVPPALVLDAAPDYLVIVESYGRLGLMQTPGFLARYELIETLETDIYESYGMQVFRRRD